MQTFFDNSLYLEFEKIYKKLKSIELSNDEEYQKDLEYVSDNLTPINPLDTTCDKEDFNVVAIDGSGAGELLTLNDISVHLITAAYGSDRTDFKNGTTKEIFPNPVIKTFPDGVLKLILIKEDDTDNNWNDFKNFIRYNYGKKADRIVIDTIKDFIRKKANETDKDKLNKKTDMKIADSEINLKASLVNFKMYNQPLTDFSKWMISPKPPKGWFDEYREILEYSLARSLLETKTHFKYLFIDGSMNLLLSPNYDQPRIMSNYVLRDLCSEALKKDTCIVAVSKTTTFPFIYRLSKDIEEKEGEKKWFFRVPSKEIDKEQLRLLANKRHIPPRYAVTYLFHFSSEVPILRIDFDIDWWKKNIYSEDKRELKKREIELFQELDWLSRDIRYYGYFFDLATSHFNSLIKFVERDEVASALIDYFAERGEDPRKYVHPRKRLGLM